MKRDFVITEHNLRRRRRRGEGGGGAFLFLFLYYVLFEDNYSHFANWNDGIVEIFKKVMEC